MLLTYRCKLILSMCRTAHVIGVVGVRAQVTGIMNFLLPLYYLVWQKRAGDGGGLGGGSCSGMCITVPNGT